MNVFENILIDENQFSNEPLPNRLNPKSWRKCAIYVEESVITSARLGSQFQFGQVFQAERLGYLAVDPSSTNKNVQLNMTCMLKLHPEMRDNILNSCVVYNFKTPNTPW